MTSATIEQQITEKKSHAISSLHQALALLQDEFSSEQTEHVLTALKEAQKALIVLEFLAQKPEEHTQAIPLAVEVPISQPHPTNEAVETTIAQTEFAQEANSSGLSLAEKLSEAPLDQLQSAFSINDRVRFAAVLFEGDMDAFLKTCDEVDGCASHAAAVQLIHSRVEGIIDWEDESGGPFQFLQLTRRLFA
ncbi:MAG: hypothetical protein P8K81_06855 [Flavobacteriales bacterium]|nr:hypothetical protein [Flavobacteriales bacterium]